MQNDAIALLESIEQLLKGKTQPIEKDHLDVSEAAAYLGVTKGWLYKLNHNKELSYHKTKKKVYYMKEDLDAYIQKNRIMSKYDMEDKAQKIFDSTHRKGGSYAR